MAIFDLSFEKVLFIEGGYKLHTISGDRGGMTFAGISRIAWPDWTGWLLIDGGETTGPRIEAMVYQFYKDNYWDVIKGGEIAFQNVAFMIYDFAVNAGIKVSVKIAQKIVGAKDDGILGPKTLDKINSYVVDELTEKLFVMEFSNRKVFHYKNICINDTRRRKDEIYSNLKFLCGWINRVEKGIVF